MRTVSGSNISIPLLIAVVALCGWTAPRTAWAEWPAFGRAISTAPNAQEHPVVASDGAGGAIVVWQDLRNPKINVFAQHVVASGELDPRWPVDGRALLGDPAALATAAGGQTAPAVVPDGAGGAIVAWQDNRDPLTAIDIYSQHVLASGVLDPKWPANGLAVTTARGLQQTFTMVSDGLGGAILAWQDGRSAPGASHIFAQHVLHDGFLDTRSPADGIPVCIARGAQEFPVAVADGIGGAILAWQDTRDSTVTGFDVYAHHVTSEGVADPAWPVNGRAVCTVTGDQGRAGITSDGLHGALIAWSDARIVGTAHIFAHHVLASGSLDPVWPIGGRGIAGTNVLESRPIAVPDGVGGAIVCWQGFTVRLNLAVDLEGTHVLIVDDERDARELLRAMLASTGARITEADSARDALRIIARDRPDIVLADIAMPGQDGYALMRAMKELSDGDGHRIRAIAVSAYARLEDKQLAERAGFNEHLAKPIHREELFDTIERVWVH